MIGTVFANIARFVLLILIQVLVLDHLDVANGYMVPYLYVLLKESYGNIGRAHV